MFYFVLLRKTSSWLIISTTLLQAHLRWTGAHCGVNWDQFVHYQRMANVVCAESGRQFCVRSTDVLMNA